MFKSKSRVQFIASQSFVELLPHRKHLWKALLSKTVPMSYRCDNPFQSYGCLYSDLSVRTVRGLYNKYSASILVIAQTLWGCDNPFQSYGCLYSDLSVRTVRGLYNKYSASILVIAQTLWGLHDEYTRHCPGAMGSA